MYPDALLGLPQPPVITVSGPLEPGPRGAIAIVGSRGADDYAREFAWRLAFDVARAGFVVVSGGAEGIDAAAHRGAMAANGATWLVACTGADAAPFPIEHAGLFADVASSARSRMIWPFPADQPKTKATPRHRNGVLVALARVVIVLQAHLKSGSRNAATWAKELERPLYVAPGAPWDTRFDGSTALLLGGAKPLYSLAHMRSLLAANRDKEPHVATDSSFKEEGPKRPEVPEKAPDQTDWSADEIRVYSHLSKGPTQQDQIIADTQLGASSTLTALLTLSLRDVVVEGPDGFFRRKSGSNSSILLSF